MALFYPNNIGRKKYFGQTDTLLVVSERYHQQLYKSTSKAKVSGYKFTEAPPTAWRQWVSAQNKRKVLFMKYYMITVSKGIFHVMLACKWRYTLLTRPHMSKKWGGGPIDCECGGRIVEVRSTKQSLIKVLTPKIIIFWIFKNNKESDWQIRADGV